MLVNIQKELKRKNISHWALCIYIILLIFIPKSFSTIFNVIPVRLLISCIFIAICLLENGFKNFFPKNKFWRFVSFIYIIFLLLSIPSFIQSYNFFTSAYTFLKFLCAYLVFLCVINTNTSEKSIKHIFRLLVVCAVIVSTIAVISYLLGKNVVLLGIEKYPGSKGRVSILFYNTIYLGIFINLIYPFVFNKFINSKNRKELLGYYAIILLFFTALVFTFTRSAFLVFCGLTIMLIVLMFKKSNWKKYIALIISIGALLFIIPGGSYLIGVSFSNGFELFDNINAGVSNFFDKFNKDDSNEQSEIPNNNNSKPNNDVPNNNNSKPNNDVPETQIPIDNNLGAHEKESEKTTQTEKIPEQFPEQNPKPISEPPQEESTLETPNSYNGDASLQHREVFAKMALKVAEDNLFGVGFGTYIDYMLSDEFTKAYPDYNESKTHPHSAVLLLSAEIGFIGTTAFLATFIFIGIYLIISLIKSFVKHDNLYLLLCSGLAVCAGFVIVNLLSENAIYDTQIFPLFLIILGLVFNAISSVGEEKNETPED